MTEAALSRQQGKYGEKSDLDKEYGVCTGFGYGDSVLSAIKQVYRFYSSCGVYCGDEGH